MKLACTTAHRGVSALTFLAAATLFPPSVTAQTLLGVDHIVYGATLTDAFRHPNALAIDPERGIIVVGDSGNNRLAFFDAMGRARGTLSMHSTRDSEVAGQAKSIGIDNRGRLFVLDGTTGIIEVLNAAGSRLGHVEPQIPDAALGRCRPNFIALAPSGSCYVGYVGETTGIAVVRPDGSTSHIFGFDPPSRSQFDSPVALAVHPTEERFAVLDPKAEHQVKVFASDGQLLHSFGPHAEGEGSFALPACVTWGPEDTLWIVDTIRHSVSVFDSDGTYRTRLFGFGTQPGQVGYPVACGFLSPEHLVVLERVGARFQILSVSTPGKKTAEGSNGLPQVGAGRSGANGLE